MDRALCGIRRKLHAVSISAKEGGLRGDPDNEANYLKPNWS